MNRKTQFETFLFKMVDNLNVLRKEHENWAELTASIDAFFQGDLSTEKTTMKKIWH